MMFVCCYSGLSAPQLQEKELLRFKGDSCGLPDADLFMLMLANIPKWVC